MAPFSMQANVVPAVGRPAFWIPPPVAPRTAQLDPHGRSQRRQGQSRDPPALRDKLRAEVGVKLEIHIRVPVQHRRHADPIRSGEG